MTMTATHKMWPSDVTTRTMDSDTIIAASVGTNADEVKGCCLIFRSVDANGLMAVSGTKIVTVESKLRFDY